jgi:hypothetical protein
MNEITQIDKTNLEQVLFEIETAFFDIPFSNTNFQCENFVIANSITPTRAYRVIGLQIHGLLNQLRDYKYAEQTRQIEIEELEWEINNENFNSFQKRKKEIELQRLKEGDLWNQKLAMDVIRQLNLYYKHFKAFPKFTNKEFEAGERLYFEQSQNRQLLGLVGAKEALINMVDDAETIKNFEQNWEQLPLEKRETLLLEIVEKSLAGKIDIKQNT